MKISKCFTFEASHILPRHPGKCSRLHGHSYKVEVSLIGIVVQDTGFVMDYGDLKSIIKPIIDTLDHQHLNWFIAYPSAENIATHIAYKLRKILPCQYMVKVRETAETEAIWSSTVSHDIDRFLEGANAGWREPIIVRKLPHDLSEEIEILDRVCPVALAEALDKYARLIQLKTYAESKII